MCEVRESEPPEDKVVEILSMLPPKSLMRFKCIRKSWCTLINSPSFVGKHLKNSMDSRLLSSTCILLNRSQTHVSPDKVIWKQEVLWSVMNLSIDGDEHKLDYVVEELHIPFPLEDHDFVQFHGYCNGIVCVIAGGNDVLCNPAIGEFRQLPDSCLLLPTHRKGKFELETSFGGLGFGYDCKAKIYKVVRIIENCEYSDDEQTFYHRIALPHTAEVYTTTANSWKEIKIDVSSSTYPYPCSVYLKGFCYWFATDGDEYVLSFHLGDEIFHRIQLPSRRESGFKFYSLLQYNESITSYCCRYDPSEESKLFEIWVMDDYDGVKSSWTNLLTVGPLKGIEYPLTLWKCNELLILASDGRATSYNSNTRDLKYLHIPRIINQINDFEALIYAESIVPIK